MVAPAFAESSTATLRAWVKPFQWLFFPVSLAFGTAAIAAALAYGIAPQPAALAISLLILGLIAIFERVLPYNAHWNRSLGDVKADVLSLAVVVAGVVLSKVAAPVAAVWLLSALHLPVGWHLVPRDWPLWAQAALVLGFIELVRYWFHRINHETKFWWPLHSIHHAVKRVYVLNGFRVHPLQQLLMYVLGYFPCIVLGAPPETLLIYTVMSTICLGFQHCNIDLRYGPLNYVFSTNEIHRWHHSTLPEEGNKNYGAIVSIFDVIFGTYYNVRGKSPETIGMANEEGYPLHDYVQQLRIPFTYSRRVKTSA